MSEAPRHPVAVRPLVFLAPMAGITDLPFRRLVRRFGADRTVSEMVASQEMVQAHAGIRAKAALEAEGTAVQLAGREAHWMAEAAKLVEGQGAEIVDINMGCPARKVTGGLSGSALMRDLDHAMTLVDAVVAAVDVPVTLKMRLGWDHGCLNAASLAKRAEDAGVALVTVHGRTRCQFYTGQADWLAIAEIKEAVRIPVIANGDIVDLKTARMALDQSRADGVMIGRGAQGKPWLPSQIRAGLAGGAAPAVPEGEALVALVAAHYDEVLAFYGRDLGLRVARKHLAWFMDEVGTPAALRREILTETDPAAVVRRLPEALFPAVADHAA